MTNQEFFTLCSKHDWYYQRSDNHGKFVDGEKTSNVLSSLARDNETFNKIYDDWGAYIFREGAEPNVENY